MVKVVAGAWITLALVACGDESRENSVDDAFVPVDANLPSFAAQQTYATGRNPTDLALGDLDGDSILDVVVPNRYDSTICALRGTGDGTFGSCATYPAGYAPGSIRVADVNTDGKLDVLVAETGFGMSPGNFVAVYINPGDGTFAMRTVYETGQGPLRIDAADLDGDGKPDLAVSNYGTIASDHGTGTTVSTLRNHGDGTFASKVDYPCGGTAPNTVAIGDVDGNGKPDLVAVNSVEGNVGVMLQATNGTFAAPVLYAVGMRPARAAIADLDADSKLDIVASNFGVGDGNTLSLLRNNGDGTFAPQQTFTVGTSPGPISIVDLNADARLDIVTSNVNARSVSILLSDGAGSFVSSGTLTVGLHPSGLGVGDVNRDGKPDLVVSNLGDSTLSVLLQQ